MKGKSVGSIAFNNCYARERCLTLSRVSTHFIRANSETATTVAGMDSRYSDYSLVDAPDILEGDYWYCLCSRWSIYCDMSHNLLPSCLKWSIPSMNSDMVGILDTIIRFQTAICHEYEYGI